MHRSGYFLLVFALFVHADIINRCATKNNHVVVVGAGMSGLGAARALITRGCNVTVLEGRDRVGGRIYFDKATGFDWGAQWIHGTFGNPIEELCVALGIRTKWVGGDEVYIGDESLIQMYDSDGSRLSEEDFELSQSLLYQLEKELSTKRDLMLRAGMSDISLWEAISSSKTYRRLSTHEKTMLHWHFEVEFGGDLAMSAPNMSFLYFGAGYENYEGGDSEFPKHGAKDGMGQIPVALAKGLNIVLNASVSEILHTASGEIVKTRNGNTYHAAAVVVTVPLGVLQSKRNAQSSIEFSPPLPKAKLQAIDALEMGVLNKAILTFPTVFWPEDQYTFGYMSDPPGQFPMIVNALLVHNTSALVFMVGGQRGVELEHMSDEEVKDAVMVTVRRLFGSDAPDPTAVMVTRWQQDPFAYGSYIGIPKDASPADVEELGRPVGDYLYFAGEATSVHDWGMSYSALWSGVRAAGVISADYSMMSETVDIVPALGLQRRSRPIRTRTYPPRGNPRLYRPAK